MQPDAEGLDLFAAGAVAAIDRLSDPRIAAGVPREFRAAAESIARQAAGGWTLKVTDDLGFAVRTAMRELRLPRSFAGQCRSVLDMVCGAANPELRAVVDALGPVEARRAAVMSAFLHYFVAHELLHVDQGLGSDQYADSDAYMPIVMEADHAADVGGLVVAARCGIPGLGQLDERGVVLLLVAIHIAGMHGFAPEDGSGLDSYAFSRLLVWYVHFARFSKAEGAPDFSSPTFVRAWSVMLPRLVSPGDEGITESELDGRIAAPAPAASDVVVAYHHEDGIYRIHRAALTDAGRVGRMAKAVVRADFDAVRIELEELLVNNPALVPRRRSAPDVEWAVGEVIDQLQGFAGRAALDGDAPARLPALRSAYDGVRAAMRAGGRGTRELLELLERGDELLDGLEAAVVDRAPADAGRARRSLLSVVDQIAVAD